MTMRTTYCANIGLSLVYCCIPVVQFILFVCPSSRPTYFAVRFTSTDVRVSALPLVSVMHHT